MISIDKLRKLATVEFERLDEDIPPDDLFDDSEAVKWVYDQLDAGNEWAWFCAHVTAKYGGVTGHAYLGGCSGLAEPDWGDLDWPDMADEALADLHRELTEIKIALTKISDRDGR